MSDNEKLQKQLDDLKRNFFRVEKKAWANKAAVSAYKEAFLSLYGSLVGLEQGHKDKQDVRDDYADISYNLQSDLKSCGYKD